MKLNIAILALSLGLFACAHHQDVRPGEDGLNSVVIQTDDKEAGSRDAISQANNYCDETKRSAVFVAEDQKYTGDMNESDYQTGKKLSKAAQMAGGAVWAMGAQKESNVGGIVGIGGATADSVLGKGYTVSMKFKCK